VTIPRTRLLPALVLMPALLAAQAATTAARTGVIFESYSFGSGLAFNRISELTIPIGVTQRVGGRVVIDVSTAFASASVNAAGGGSGEITHSGFVDTDLRATVTRFPASWCSVSSAPSRRVPPRFPVRLSPCSVPRALVFWIHDAQLRIWRRYFSRIRIGVQDGAELGGRNRRELPLRDELRARRGRCRNEPGRGNPRACGDRGSIRRR